MATSLTSSGITYYDNTTRSTARWGQRAIFGFGLRLGSTGSNVINRINNLGLQFSDTSGVGTARYALMAAGWAGDRAFFLQGYNLVTTLNMVAYNLVDNLGTIVADQTGGGTGKRFGAAASFDVGQARAISGFGNNDASTSLSSTNIFSYNIVTSGANVASDVSNVGTARSRLAAVTYGDDKALFAFGSTVGGASYLNLTSKFNSSGVYSSESSTIASGRQDLAGANYGGKQKAVFAFGFAGVQTTQRTYIDINGNVESDSTALGTARAALAAASYGGDKAIFAYGEDPSLVDLNNTILVSNVGVVATSTTGGVGSTRTFLAAASYGS